MRNLLILTMALFASVTHAKSVIEMTLAEYQAMVEPSVIGLYDDPFVQDVLEHVRYSDDDLKKLIALDVSLRPLLECDLYKQYGTYTAAFGSDPVFNVLNVLCAPDTVIVQTKTKNQFVLVHYRLGKQDARVVFDTDKKRYRSIEWTNSEESLYYSPTMRAKDGKFTTIDPREIMGVRWEETLRFYHHTLPKLQANYDNLIAINEWRKAVYNERHVGDKNMLERFYDGSVIVKVIVKGE